MPKCPSKPLGNRCTPTREVVEQIEQESCNLFAVGTVVASLAVRQYPKPCALSVAQVCARLTGLTCYAQALRQCHRDCVPRLLTSVTCHSVCCIYTAALQGNAGANDTRMVRKPLSAALWANLLHQRGLTLLPRGASHMAEQRMLQKVGAVPQEAT